MMRRPAGPVVAEDHMRTAVAAALLTLAAGPAGAAAQMTAEVTCLATPQALTYDCLVRLTRPDGRTAIEGADVTVVADQPASPLGPKARPVAATGIGQPGIYAFRLTLRQIGEWSLRIGLTRPIRDIVETTRVFGERAVTPKR
jgi:hypothetical protein